MVHDHDCVGCEPRDIFIIMIVTSRRAVRLRVKVTAVTTVPCDCDSLSAWGPRMDDGRIECDAQLVESFDENSASWLFSRTAGPS